MRAERLERALTRFAGAAIHQNVDERSVTVHLRVALDGGRSAASSTTVPPDGRGGRGGAMADLVASTLAAARLTPRDPRWPGVAGPAAAEGALPRTGTDPETAEAGPERRAALVAAFVDAARGSGGTGGGGADGLTCAGYVQTSARTAVLATTAGQHVSGSATSATCDGIARLPGSGTRTSTVSDGVARSVVARVADLDVAALGARAGAKARAGLDPVEVPLGAYPVVLEPAAVADVVAGLLGGPFDGRSLADGTSGVRLGEQQLDAAVSLADDPLVAGGVALPFDVEGTPARRTELVRAGVPVAVLTDRRTAAELGGASTGSASGSPGDTTASGPVLAPGDGGDVGDLVATLERGLLVSDLWYTRVVEARRVVWTGLTRNGVWLVENGEVVSAVGTLRFTQSYLEAFAPGAVVVGSVAEGQPRALSPMAWGTDRVLVPALRLAAVERHRQRLGLSGSADVGGQQAGERLLEGLAGVVDPGGRPEGDVPVGTDHDDAVGGDAAVLQPRQPHVDVRAAAEPDGERPDRQVVLRGDLLGGLDPGATPPRRR